MGSNSQYWYARTHLCEYRVIVKRRVYETDFDIFTKTRLFAWSEDIPEAGMEQTSQASRIEIVFRPHGLVDYRNYRRDFRYSGVPYAATSDGELFNTLLTWGPKIRGTL